MGSRSRYLIWNEIGFTNCRVAARRGTGAVREQFMVSCGGNSGGIRCATHADPLAQFTRPAPTAHAPVLPDPTLGLARYTFQWAALPRPCLLWRGGDV